MTRRTAARRLGRLAGSAVTDQAGIAAGAVAADSIRLAIGPINEHREGAFAVHAGGRGLARIKWRRALARGVTGFAAHIIVARLPRFATRAGATDLVIAAGGAAGEHACLRVTDLARGAAEAVAADSTRPAIGVVVQGGEDALVREACRGRLT